MKEVQVADEQLLDPRLLRLFDALYSLGSVSAAAEELGLSQPTASLQLARLRAAIGDPLFVRSPTGMRPTPRADELIAAVRTALDALRRVSTGRTGFSPEQASRRFRVHMSDASNITLLPALFERVRGESGDVRIDAITIDAQTPAELRSGAGDLALGFVPALETGFLSRSLFDQRWVCLVGAKHPRVSRSMSRAGYEAERHVTIARGTGAALLDERLVDAGVVREAVLTVPGVLGLPAILGRTELVATVPEQVGRQLARDRRLRVVPCPLDVGGFIVKCYWHARFDADPAHRWLRGIVVELFGARGGRNSGRPVRA